MGRTGVGLLATVVAWGGVSLAIAAEGESSHPRQPVTMAELPAAAQKTFKREANGAQIEELRKETRSDGTVVYEGEIVAGGRGTDLEVSADGTLLQRSKSHDEASEHRKK